LARGLAAWAATYQPITWGCCEWGPTGSDVRPVNTFGYYREDFYLAPRQGTATFFVTIVIEIPLRTNPCAIGSGWEYDPSFYVKERFLFFTHTVALP
jgi:hypothetical protein